MQKKANGQENLWLNFLTKPVLCLAWVTHTENRGHRLSGQEAKAEGQRVQWAQEKTLSQFRNCFSTKKVNNTYRPVREIARETD